MTTFLSVAPFVPLVAILSLALFVAGVLVYRNNSKKGDEIIEDVKGIVDDIKKV